MFHRGISNDEQKYASSQSHVNFIYVAYIILSIIHFLVIQHRYFLILWALEERQQRPDLYINHNFNPSPYYDILKDTSNFTNLYYHYFTSWNMLTLTLKHKAYKVCCVDIVQREHTGTYRNIQDLLGKVELK